MGDTLKTQWRRQWERQLYQWLDKRAPPAARFRLNRKNLYTFPSVTGFVFFGLTLIMWMLGTNYQNNLILALAYTLISVFVVTILHGYMNLAAMEVRWLGAAPAFAGEEVGFQLELCSGSRLGSESVELGFAAGARQSCSLDAKTTLQLQLYCPSVQRGYLRPGRLLLQSYFPLGIIRCWTWLNFGAVGLVYPSPKAIPEPVASAAVTSADAEVHETGGEDFSGLKPYQPGDPIKHIAWKVYARDKGLFSKEYTQPMGGDTWLDWHHVAATDLELKLSGLCYWALAYHRQGRAFGLRLPNSEVEIGTGDGHLHACLRALALYQLTNHEG